METHPNVTMSWERPAPPKVDKGIADRLMARFFAPGGAVAGSGAGAWSQDRYQQVLHYVGWTAIAVRAIASEIAGLMPQVGFLLDADLAAERKRFGRKMLEPYHRRKALVSAQESAEIEPAPHNHRLVRLMQNPNKPDVAWTYSYRLAMYLELTGNAYEWIVPDMATGLPIQKYVLPSHWVRAIAGEDEMVSGYEIRPFGGYGGARSAVIPPHDVIHTAYPGPLSVIDGLSPIQGSALWLDVAQSMDVSRLAAFKKGIKSDLILSLDPDFANPDQATIDRLLEQIDKRYSGESNFARAMLMPGGVVPHTVGRSVAEMDYIQSGEAARDQSLATHMIGKGVVGITEVMSRASLDAILAQYIRSTIKPKLTLIGQVQTENLARRFDPRCVIYYPDPTPLDPMQLNADIAADFAVGAISPNEVRQLRGREKWEFGGNDPMAPMGLTPMPWNTGQEQFTEPVGFVEPDGGLEEPIDDLDGGKVPQYAPSRNGVAHARRW